MVSVNDKGKRHISEFDYPRDSARVTLITRVRSIG